MVFTAPINDASCSASTAPCCRYCVVHTCTRRLTRHIVHHSLALTSDMHKQCGIDTPPRCIMLHLNQKCDQWMLGKMKSSVTELRLKIWEQAELLEGAFGYLIIIVSSKALAASKTNRHYNIALDNMAAINSPTIAIEPDLEASNVSDFDDPGQNSSSHCFVVWRRTRNGIQFWSVSKPDQILIEERRNWYNWMQLLERVTQRHWRTMLPTTRLKTTEDIMRIKKEAGFPRSHGYEFSPWHQV